MSGLDLQDPATVVAVGVVVSVVCITAASLFIISRRRERDRRKKRIAEVDEPPADSHSMTSFKRLLQACKDGNLALARSLVDDTSDFHHKTNDGCSALHLACIEGNLELVEWLLDTVQRRDSRLFSLLLDDPADNGWTALDVACAQGHHRVVSLLLSKNCNATRPDGAGNTPLMISSCNGHLECVELLLAHESCTEELLCATNNVRKNAFHLASQQGHTEIVRRLLAKRKELGVIDECRSTTSEHEQFDISHFTSDSSDDQSSSTSTSTSTSTSNNTNDNDTNDEPTTSRDPLSRGDIAGNTPLHAAALGGSVEIVRLLLDARASASRVSSTGVSALHVCCLRDDTTDRTAVAEVLLAAGASLNSYTSFGTTPLHDAALHSNYQLVCLLLERELTLASSNEAPHVPAASCVQDYDGLFPLHMACQAASRDRKDMNDAAVVRVLERFLQHPTIDVNCRDYADCTPLQYLACSPRRRIALEMAKMLLNAGASPLATDVTGWNSLHVAARSDYPFSREMLALLEKHAKEHEPEAYARFDPTLERGSNELYHHRKGPQNRIPLAIRQAVLDGDKTVQGIARYLDRFRTTHSRLPRIIVMTGAGVSVSAGIPDFRSVGTGLYANAAGRNAFDAAIFHEQPEVFYNVLQKTFLPVVNGDVRPTTTHHFIKLLHAKGMLYRLYTQNVDLLDRVVGIPSDKLVEAHGSLSRAYCSEPRCTEEADMQQFWQAVAHGAVPRCWRCSSAFRPDIVLFGEGMPRSFHEQSEIDMPKADLLIVMGTTLVVYPFAGLVSRVPLLTPRLLLNRELTGPFKNLTLESNYRDAAFVGNCDDGILQLAEALGWDQELRRCVDDAKHAKPVLYFQRRFT